VLITVAESRRIMSVPKGAPVLLNAFSTFEAGGAQTRFVTLANRFGSALRQIVVAMDGNYGFARQLAPGLDVHFPEIEVRKGNLIANWRAFRRAIRTFAPDILVTHNWGTIEWAMANIPRIARHIHIEDGFGPDEAERQVRRRVWTRRLVLGKSTVVVPSRNLQRIARETWGIPENRLFYIPNGIDCARFAVPPDRESIRDWPGDGPVIGTVAALRAEKNLQRLIRAFGAVAKEFPCRLIVAGEGSERSHLESLATELELRDRIFFAGHAAEPELFYGAFDIFALTSDTEQMPYSVLEAMAAGCPVVATDVGDIGLMVAAENLPYIVARDERAVEAALRQLLSDENLRKRIGDANKKRAVAEFDQRAMFDAFARLYGIEGSF
jgi:glycosyltransferase involved in cell wall biosynthesis